MSFCYGIAWIFLFEMSHHTSQSVKYPGRSLNFPPAQSCFELSLDKGPSRPGRFCIPFTDAKPAREMHMRRNHLDGDGRKN